MILNFPKFSPNFLQNFQNNYFLEEEKMMICVWWGEKEVKGGMRDEDNRMRDKSRVENSLINFGTKSLVFCQKSEHSKWVICSKSEQFAQKVINSLIRSFMVSDLMDSLTIAHSFWATWAKRSRSLICPERPEPFAHFAQKE